MTKIEVFHTFSKEKYRDCRIQGISDLYFQYDSLIEIGVKIDVFELFLSKSIVNADNGVFFTLIFSTIPL